MKVVIFKETFEDTKWIEESRSVDYVIYSYKILDNNSIDINQREQTPSYAYLKYIIDNYNSLPQWMLFLNAREKDALHPSSKIITCHLNVTKLKYNKCKFFPLGHDDHSKIVIKQNKDRLQPYELNSKEYQELIKEVFGENEYNNIINRFFKNKGIIDVQSFPQGSQFLVARESILKRPLSFYDNCFNLLTNKFHVLNMDYSKTLVHFFFEAHWHFIFSEPFLYYDQPYRFFSEMPLSKS